MLPCDDRRLCRERNVLQQLFWLLNELTDRKLQGLITLNGDKAMNFFKQQDDVTRRKMMRTTIPRSSTSGALVS